VANRLVSYLRESREELRKVSWPRWPETRNNTLLVIGISLFTAAFLGLCDLIFSNVLTLVLNAK
jgi:preprotein translocase subunit SecE